MGLSKEAIEEFKDIYRQEFKEDISDGKARELGENLISLFRVIYRPIPDDIKTPTMKAGILDTIHKQREDVL